MKKKLALLLSALMVLGALAGCGANNGPTAGQPEKTANTTSAGYSTDGSVIFDKDGVTVTTAGLDADPTSTDGEPIIWVDVRNAGAQDVYLGVTDGSVNGVVTEVLLVSFEEENGEYIGASYLGGQTIPTGDSARYALGYDGTNVPGIDLSQLGELEFCFTTSEDEYTWYDYKSEPVVITVDASIPAPDITALGTVAVDDDRMTLVVGDQDYDDWFGPMVYVYMLNKSDKFIGVSADSAELDGVACDYLLGGLAAAPGKAAAAFLSFDGEARELKGFENMTLNLTRYEGANSEEVDLNNGAVLDPITMQYPPQIWGAYENGGLSFEVQPKYNDHITVETPANDPDGILFAVSETASMEAGGYEGAGWLFSIGSVSEKKLHEMLGNDMSGAEVFAKGGDESYYIYYHPTDVRYERATVEEMTRDQAQWTTLCEWAENVPMNLAEKNGLESKSFSNTDVDIYLARAAWLDGVNATLSTTEYGPVEVKGVDGTPYAEYVMHGFFDRIDDAEAPDGEYVVLNFPDDDVRLDFFFAPDNYVRVTSGGSETLYQAVWWDDDISNAGAMQGWYYAVAEAAGVKPRDDSLLDYCGLWYEKIAGRGQIQCAASVAPGKVRIAASWPDSAALMNEWEMVATLEDDKLVYENGYWALKEYDESGEGWIQDESYEESGYFYLNGSGELCWHDDRAERDGDSEFISAG